MAAKGLRTKTSIYQVKVRLLGVKPPVWRRFIVPGEITLGMFHNILQVVIGWENYHAHFFRVGETEYGPPQLDIDGMKNENRARLNNIVTGPRMKIYYEYDLGDGWLHSIIFEKFLQPEPGSDYPICIAGKRACPPEDCGGPGGYEHFLEVMGNPDDPEHEDMLFWAGEEFDPEAFDIDRVNQALRRLKTKWRL